MEKPVDVIQNLVQAVSLLTKIDEYLDGLDEGLSKDDSLLAQYEHFIENEDVDKVNLRELFLQMQRIYKKRRTIKDNISLRTTYRQNNAKLNNIANREMFIQYMKNAQAKIPKTYVYNLIPQEDMEKLRTVKRGPGRPKKEKVDKCIK